MDERLRILLVDEDPHDRALALLVLRKALPEAEVHEVAEAVALVQPLAAGRYTAVVTECRLSWAEGPRVLEALRGRFPEAALVVFSRTDAQALLDQARGLPPPFDGYVRKDSAGFLALPEVVRGALERRSRAPLAGAGEEGRYGRFVESLPLGVFFATPQGVISHCNRAMADILGAPAPGELEGSPLARMLADDALAARWERALARGEALRGVEGHVRRRDGERAWVRLSARPVRGEGEALEGWEGTLEDITPYKMAEEKLSRQAQALSRSNEELWQLSYALSHDLQEPVQLAVRYARTILERHAKALGKEGHELVEHLMRSALRAQDLVDAVLEYSSLTGVERPLKPVDLNAVVAEALDNLRPAVDESGADVRYHGLPTVLADERQMLQLLQNLINNAIKFRGDDPPRVDIAAADRGDHWQLSVRDNGIGMSAEQAQRIFGMFQRLHTEEEYPGTGIGLAICKKVVERHEGRIWVLSQPSKGSTFFVTLPKRTASEANDNRDAG